jgi:hypothetical protein
MAATATLATIEEMMGDMFSLRSTRDITRTSLELETVILK